MYTTSYVSQSGGCPGGDTGDDPHSVMGDVTEPALKAMKIPFSDLTVKNWESEMKNAIKKMVETSSPVVLLVKQGVLSK